MWDEEEEREERENRKWTRLYLLWRIEAYFWFHGLNDLDRKSEPCHDQWPTYYRDRDPLTLSYHYKLQVSYYNYYVILKENSKVHSLFLFLWGNFWADTELMMMMRNR
jgi:hypothetical protein